MLESLEVSGRGGASKTVIANIDYNEKGQRIVCEYADPTAATSAVTFKTSYSYDPLTFRLAGIVTNRLASGSVSAAKLQDLRYTYDPVGNIVALDDAADTAPIFSGNVPLSGDGRYRYDSIYRLIQTEGREHPGQTGTSTQPRADYEIPMAAIPHPNDLQAVLRYLEKYSYDQVGNIREVGHSTIAPGGGPSPSWTQWTRKYNYATTSNRLLGTSEPGDHDRTYGATYDYDDHGSMIRMSHLPVVAWDHADHMQHASKGGGGDVYFTYDGSGQRVRKVWEHGGLTDERIYLGGYEIYRKRSGSTLQLERQTLHVMDDKRRVAMMETKTVDLSIGPSVSRWRYQLDNHLGSSAMEVEGSGKVISYEEYHPYGSTAFHSADLPPELSAKRYRYTGKEKDEETGLYYHGARYYAPWLGRWTAADPAGTRDGANLFWYARCTPMLRTDSTGTQSEEPPTKRVLLGRHGFTGHETTEELHALARARGRDFSGTPRWDSATRSWDVGRLTKISGAAPVKTSVVPGDTGQRVPVAKNERLRSAANAGTAEAAAVAHDAVVRDSYHAQTAEASSEAVGKVRVARAAAAADPSTTAENLAKARQAAQTASEARDALRSSAQARQSAVGRSISQAMQKPPQSFDARVAAKVPPGQAATFNTYEAIAKGAASTRGSANVLATGFKVAGGIGVAAGVGISVYNVAKAPEGQKGRVASEEAGGLAFGLMGGVVGGEIGAAAVGIGMAALGLSNPVGWAVIAGAVVGSLVVGYLMAERGRETGRGIFDLVAQ